MVVGNVLLWPSNLLIHQPQEPTFCLWQFSPVSLVVFLSSVCHIEKSDVQWSKDQTQILGNEYSWLILRPARCILFDPRYCPSGLVLGHRIVKLGLPGSRPCLAPVDLRITTDSKDIIVERLPIRGNGVNEIAFVLLRHQVPDPGICVDRVLVVKVSQRLHGPALPAAGVVGHGLGKVVHPDVVVGVVGDVAGEVVEDAPDAVLEVVHLGGAGRVDAVVLGKDDPPQRVEAVQLVRVVEARQVSLVAVAPVVGDADVLVRVLAQPPHVVGRDEEHVADHEVVVPVLVRLGAGGLVPQRRGRLFAAGGGRLGIFLEHRTGTAVVE